MYQSSSTKSFSPATAALEEALKLAASPKISDSKPMIKSKSLKRSVSPMDSFDLFDMSAFDQASQEVEASIAFPAIEFPGFDDSEDEELIVPSPSKRRCRGLVRSSQASLNLSSLEFERCGSSGSLC